ncbi:MAG: LPS export ABC transporter periplasmic protein LptC [Desulfobacteraceae bacterium 4572_88]|nr:MAG: LPS export ABC transporter periplasmic protein LptC [Desulfobacteraceae bacterium 4572_88]RLC21896.1 MAG: LPS export ABC transporter periplasmic protein LptC [Deltaproteobacteria bacterium]
MRSKKLKIVLLLVIVCVFGAVVAVFIGDRQQGPESQDTPVSSISDDANISIGKVSQTATRDGIKEWRLDAGSARYLNEKKQGIFQKLSVTFFLEDGNEVSLTADQGILSTDSNDMTVSGHVVVKNENYRLETEKLYYEHGPRMLFSKMPVRISGTAFEFMADTMSLDLNSKDALFEGNVEGTLGEHATL